MKQKLIVEFTKMNGTGNDFIVIDNRFYHFSDDELSDIARALCPRRTGIGADGVLALARPTTDEADFRMRYANADGSIATMCGNGARCLARFARLGGIASDPLVFETDAGIHRAAVQSDGTVSIEMRDPKDFRAFELEEAGRDRTFFIWTGTEHLVRLVDDASAIDVAVEGEALRHHPALQPAGANVNFVEVKGSDRLFCRTFEKGVEGETPACGTGAAAAAITAYRAGWTSEPAVDVETQGGLLRVSFDASGDDIRDVRLSGPTEIVFRGTFEWG